MTSVNNDNTNFKRSQDPITTNQPDVNKSSFIHLKDIYESQTDFADDNTETGDNTSSPKYISKRMAIIFTVPKLEEDVEDNQAAFEAINKMN